MLIPCEKRGCTNPASGLWRLYSKPTKAGKVRSKDMNLCASCGFSAHTWVRMYVPPSKDPMTGEPIEFEHPDDAEPRFGHLYERAELIGKPVSFGRSRTFSRKRVSTGVVDVDAQLEALGLTVPESIRSPRRGQG